MYMYTDETPIKMYTSTNVYRLYSPITLSFPAVVKESPVVMVTEQVYCPASSGLAEVKVRTC